MRFALVEHRHDDGKAGHEPPAKSLGRFRERAAAARSLSGGAAVAMAGDADRIVREVGVEQVGQMHARASAVGERQARASD